MQLCYVITNPAWKDHVKIGFTSKSTMKSRLSTYQTGTPFRDYEIYHTVEFEDAREAESKLKARLNEMNATCSSGEWYKMPASIAANLIDMISEEMKE